LDLGKLRIQVLRPGPGIRGQGIRPGPGPQKEPGQKKGGPGPLNRRVTGDSEVEPENLSGAIGRVGPGGKPKNRGGQKRLAHPLKPSGPAARGKKVPPGVGKTGETSGGVDKPSSRKRVVPRGEPAAQTWVAVGTFANQGHR